MSHTAGWIFILLAVTGARGKLIQMVPRYECVRKRVCRDTQSMLPAHLQLAVYWPELQHVCAQVHHAGHLGWYRAVPCIHWSSVFRGHRPRECCIVAFVRHCECFSRYRLFCPNLLKSALSLQVTADSATLVTLGGCPFENRANMYTLTEDAATQVWLVHCPASWKVIV